MLKSYEAVLGLAVLLALTGDSLGRSRHLSPTSRQQDQTKTQQQKAPQDQRGTEDFPLIVQPLPPKETADETSYKTREANEKTNSEFWTWFLRERHVPEQNGIYEAIQVTPMKDAIAGEIPEIEFSWFYGTIAYMDVLGKQRYTRFRWRYNRVSQEFCSYGGPPLQ